MLAKTYPAADVIPQKGGVVRALKKMKAEEAVNLPLEKRQTFLTAITRMNKTGNCKFRTVKISDSEFALIRES